MLGLPSLALSSRQSLIISTNFKNSKRTGVMNSPKLLTSMISFKDSKPTLSFSLSKSLTSWHSNPEKGITSLSLKLLNLSSTKLMVFILSSFSINSNKSLLSKKRAPSFPITAPKEPTSNSKTTITFSNSPTTKAEFVFPLQWLSNTKALFALPKPSSRKLKATQIWNPFKKSLTSFKPSPKSTTPFSKMGKTAELSL